MKRKAIIFVMLLLLITTGSYWIYNNAYRFILSVHSDVYTPERYKWMKDTLSVERKRIALKYGSTHGANKSEVLQKAGQMFVAAVTDSIFPFWYDTDWDFNGTTEVPGQGSIACGYFVTTVLRDAGANINRVKLACCASEEMIKALVPAKDIQRFSNIPIEDFVKAVRLSGDGVYIVGLDNHTGFIVCLKGNVRFVHSGGGMPSRVVNQNPVYSKLIARSKYRVLGKLSSSNAFIGKWMTGEKFN